MRLQTTPAKIAILISLLPIAAFADITGTVTLQVGNTLNLDSGATGTTGGDIIWSGAAMSVQGTATMLQYVNVGASASGAFSSLNQSILSGLGPQYSNLQITAATLTTDDIFFVHTNGGNYAVLLVTATGIPSTLTLQYKTFGSTTASGPTITEVENNYGEIPPGFANSGIAQGALFFIVGSGMATPGSVAVLQNAVGVQLPKSLNQASVSVTVNGTTVSPSLYYSQPTAIGAVLPSNTPIGTGTVTVTYNNQTSNAFSIQVVATAMGFDAYFGTGGGLGVATNAVTGALYNYGNSIPPGTAVVLWGSGLGADPKPTRDSTYVGVTSVAADSINGLAHIYVGGVDAAIGYQGASGYPGLNQINITIPGNAPTGCNVEIVGVSAAGVPTNFLTLPIGHGACSDPSFGISGAQTQTLLGQSSVATGIVGILQSTETAAGQTSVYDVAVANFQSSTGSTYVTRGQVSLGGCVVNQTVTSTSGATSTTGLSAGTITVTGPSGSPVTLTSVPTVQGSYYANLVSGYIPVSGGTVTFTGTGGANVGPFTTSVVIPTPALSWTNESAAATVTRSSGLTVNWSGGSPNSYVVIAGSSSSLAGASGDFTCLSPVSAGQFTVPSYVLSALPAGTGTVSVENNSDYGTFTASGLDFGAAYGLIGFDINSTYN